VVMGLIGFVRTTTSISVHRSSPTTCEAANSVTTPSTPKETQ
jgi:hypothetical protein